MSTSTPPAIRRENTFVDASAWTALFDGKEAQHQSALDTWKALIERGCPITTSTWTLFEALTVLNGRQHSIAVELWKFVQDEAYRIEMVDGCRFESEALDKFIRYSDKTASVVDHVNFAIITANKCMQAFTYDRKDFGPAAGMLGFRLIPPAPAP